MDIPDMQHQMMGYDRSATMFSPDGHILQVEYAEKTVRLGSASIGMLCKDGVVIIADKGFKDELIVQKSAEKIYEIDEHIISSAAGFISDARVLMTMIHFNSILVMIVNLFQDVRILYHGIRVYCQY